MNTRIPCRSGFALALLLAGSTLACRPAPPSPDAVATYDQGEITLAELEAFRGELPPGRRTPPPEADPTDWSKRQVERVFIRKVMVTPAAIEALSNEPAFESEITTAIRGALARAYMANHNTQMRVTRPELEAHFEAHKERFLRPELRSFRSILIAVPDNASAEERRRQRAKAEELRDRIAAGEAFETVAREASDSVSAATGGFVAPKARHQLRPAVADVVFSLQTGEISEVVSSAAGFHIFRVIGIRPADPPELDRHLPRVAEAVMTKKRTDYYDQVVADTLAERGVESEPWPEAGYPPDFAAGTVYFELDDHRVLGSDVVALAQQLGSPSRAYRRLVGDLVLSAAFAAQWPGDVDPIERQVRRRLATAKIERQSLRDYVEALPADRLESFFNDNTEIFVSDTQVELTQFSWPLDPESPEAQMSGPTRFAEALRHAPEEALELWEAEVAKSGAVRRGYPLLAVSVIANRQPGLVLYLSENPTSGEIIGPYRVGNSLNLIKVETVAPSRQLSFAEARASIPAEMLRRNRAAVVEEWIGDLAAEYDLQIIEERLLAPVSAPDGAEAGTES
jgi:hypothetical protein